MNKPKSEKKISTEKPLFSIIIPTYERPHSIEKTLLSISDLKQEQEPIQVVVVNDASRVPYDTVIEKYKKRLDLKYTIQKHQGPARARNRGAELATGQYLVFIDDDCTFSPSWFQSVRNAVKPDRVVGGKTVNNLDENIFAVSSQVLIDYLYSYYNKEHQSSLFLTSNNMIVPRVIFNAIHGFDTTFIDAAAEDRDFCDRLLKAGYKIVYHPEILIHHFHKMNFRHYLHQHFKYGCMAELFHEKRLKNSHEKYKFEPLSFYINLLLFPFQKHKTYRAILISILLIFSQIANAIGFFSAKIKK